MGYVTINRFSSFRTINTIFQQLLAETPPKATIGYLPPITAPLTKMSVIYAFIDRTFKMLLFIEADQAIYSILLDAMFKMSEENVFSTLIPII